MLKVVWNFTYICRSTFSSKRYRASDTQFGAAVATCGTATENRITSKLSQLTRGKTNFTVRYERGKIGTRRGEAIRFFAPPPREKRQVRTKERNAEISHRRECVAKTLRTNVFHPRNVVTFATWRDEIQSTSSAPRRAGREHNARKTVYKGYCR